MHCDLRIRCLYTYFSLEVDFPALKFRGVDKSCCSGLIVKFGVIFCSVYSGLTSLEEDAKFFEFLKIFEDDLHEQVVVLKRFRRFP